MHGAHNFCVIMGDLSKEDINTIKSSFLTSIGSIIRKNRLKKNISQEELSNFIDVNQGTLSRYEQGTQDINASLLPVISVYCDFPMKEYIDISLDKDLFSKFRRIVSVEAARYKRKQAREGKPKKELKAKVYLIDGVESYEPVYRKENRAEAIIECQESYPVEPFTEEEFKEFVQKTEKLDFSIIGPSNEMIECLDKLEEKETLKGEVADFVIKELIVKPLLKDKAGKDAQIQRLYMLYKLLFEKCL